VLFYLKFAYKNETGTRWHVDLLDTESHLTVKDMLIAEKLTKVLSSNDNNRSCYSQLSKFGDSESYLHCSNEEVIFESFTADCPPLKPEMAVLVTNVSSPSDFYVLKNDHDSFG
jgi:hypothetical protein